ncbi:MAG: ABC transporter permease subunit [Bdellovibrionales bacterium]|nr:ABC transporter permease subunit [Bdellovibrionales bacterium]
MRAIFTIAWKDLKALLTNPLFYVIGGMCTVLWSYTYMRSLLEFAERSRMFAQPGMDSGPNIQNTVIMAHISLTNLLFIFVLPALTMRLLAEEKRMRTYDLLLTSPITATQIAVGKFFAGWGAAVALAGISLLYPLATRLVVSYPMGPLFSAYLGMILVAGAYVAVGLFASALTESIMLSVVLGLIFNILLWFISQGAGEGHFYTPVVEYLSLGQHFVGFIMGAVKLNSTVFLLSLITLFVFLTQRVVESSRWR